MHQILNFIDGRSVPAGGGRWLDVHEPATGRVYARVADSDASDIDAAVQAAGRAFEPWSRLSPAERSTRLFRLADLLDANLERLALAESVDTGKPLSLARSVDIPRSAANFRFFAGAALHTSGETHEFDSGPMGSAQSPGAPGVRAFNYTFRRPRGVAGLISPWNLPLYLLSWKIAPALATGNTAVCKPSEVTPMTGALLGELSLEAGIPPGVLNIVHGRGPQAGGALVTHPNTPTLSFTGSTPVGRWIAREAGDRLKRVSLELGGKNPFIIFDDAELDGPDGAIATAVRAAFTNQGQICLCGSRLLVQQRVYDRVLAEVVEGAKALRIGDPLDAGTSQGALVSAQHLDKVRAAVDSARAHKGTVHCGGRSPDPATLPERVRSGWFYLPTVISGLEQCCPVVQEEIFGPVVTVQRFETEDEAVALANGTPYGLAASLFTGDLARAHRVADRIDSGIVWINCWMVRDLRTPFGGAKQSGVGREGGQEALKFFTEPKNVCVRV